MLAQRKDTYISGLEAYRAGDVDGWCAQFAGATAHAAGDAERRAEAVDVLEAEWLDRLGHPRADAASRRLVAALPAHPVLDVKAAPAITGKSHVAVGRAIASLEAAAILRPLSDRKWGRAWECTELLDVVEDFEASLGA